MTTLLLLAALAGPTLPHAGDLAKRLRALDPAVLEKAPANARLLARDVRARLRRAGWSASVRWQALKDREEWEALRIGALQKLRESLGALPEAPENLKVRVRGTRKGKGYRIDNIVFESRPGLAVTANLYRPGRAPKAAPGILICHSHHNPKTQRELQDMGVLWARAGCLVLVMDQLGHGERLQHPFRTKKDYPHPFRVSRQDYYFRFNVGVQLHLAGESLLGWMVNDLMRGVDVLLQQPGIARHKIILLGAVAGGGDPAAVAGALDERIAAVVPFNFGGPQPETVYPLPADPEKRFLYTGSGTWESTRNLYCSARDGFLPWVIVGAIAPRRLIYAHEFAWDRDHDPVWKRLRTIYAWYGKPDHLASVHGRGSVSGRPPKSTHCDNIGAVHRAGIHKALRRWFGIQAKEPESRKHHAPSELMCLTTDIKTRPVHELAGELAAERLAAARRARRALEPSRRASRLREQLRGVLGAVEPWPRPAVRGLRKEEVGKITVERFTLDVGATMQLPMLLLLPPRKPGTRLPVVVAVAQGGKQAFLRERSAELARLLEGGAAVALPDLRGTGETAPGAGRAWRSTATAIASSELMLGQTLLGARLADLRTLVRYLATRDDLHPARVALWGESFAPTNPDSKRLRAPLDAEKPAFIAEPLGGLLALLGALYEPRVSAALARGGLAGYETVLRSPFCAIPYDVVVPGILQVADMADIAGALAPRPVKLAGLVDGLNRAVEGKDLDALLRPARAAYQEAKAEKALVVGREARKGGPAEWLLAGLSAEGSGEERAVLEALARLGARVRRTEDRPGKPVSEVGLGKTRAADADLYLLRYLPALEELSLRETPVTDDGLKALAGLGKLQYLDLRWTRIGNPGLKHLRACKELAALDLDGTNVTGAGLRALVGRRWRLLRVPDRARTDLGLKYLVALTRPSTRLDLRGWVVTDEGIEHLRALTKLRTLELSGTRISDAGLKVLGKFKALETLGLSKTWVHGPGLKEIKGLKKLQSLTLGHTWADNDTMKHLRGLHALRNLELTRTYVGDAGLKELKHMRSLRSLELSRTEVTDAGMRELRGLKALEVLGLGSDDVGDRALKELRHLPALRALDLSNTRVSNAGLKELRAFKALRTLDLSWTRVDDAGLKHLAGLSGLRLLNLHKSLVTVSGANRLRKALPRCSIPFPRLRPLPP
jgi:dienelactone hydrolase